MTIDSVLDSYAGYIASTRETIHLKKYRNKDQTKLALLEIIKGVRPKKKDTSGFSHKNSAIRVTRVGFNQGCDEYEKKLREMFK